MKFSSPALAAALAILGAAQLSGCSTTPAAQPNGQIVSGTIDRPTLHSVNGNRYISGPYGDTHQIFAVMAMIERHSKPQQISVQGIKLTGAPAHSFISVYKYTLPKSCGLLRFQLYKGDGSEILEYDDRPKNGAPIEIRDYVRGPSPFIGPGLWGPYDSSSNAPTVLLPGNAGQDGMGLMRGAYAIGWVTTLSPGQQMILGKRYAKAIKQAASCG